MDKKNMPSAVRMILGALVGPILLIPVEIILPYPAVVEEIYKFLIIDKKTKKTFRPLVAGLVFAVSETILYTNQILGKQNGWVVIVERLVLTAIMHSTTMLIIYLGKKRDQKWGFVGLLTAIIIHTIYNAVIGVF